MYIRIFADEADADLWMRAKNRVSRDGEMYCVVDGPQDDYAVVDLRTAIELGGPYRWA